MTEPTPPHPSAPSLEPLLAPEPAGPGTPAPAGAGQARMWAAMTRLRTAEERKWLRRVGLFTLALVVLGGGAVTVLALMPRRVPDYLNDNMEQVLDFTLLSDDFNKLPIDRRLALLQDFIQRLKSMSSDDSALLAQFAASIREQMRRQLEQNIKRLGMDMMDKYARDYAGVPPEDQPGFLDKTVLELTRMMEQISGEKSGLPDDDDARLAALKKQAQRDQERFRQRAPAQMDPQRVAGFVGFLQRDSAKVANPAERARVTKFMRDMTRHLRGEDPSTGKPVDGPR